MLLGAQAKRLRDSSLANSVYSSTQSSGPDLPSRPRPSSFTLSSAAIQCHVLDSRHLHFLYGPQQITFLNVSSPYTNINNKTLKGTHCLPNQLQAAAASPQLGLIPQLSVPVSSWHRQTLYPGDPGLLTDNKSTDSVNTDVALTACSATRQQNNCWQTTHLPETQCPCLYHRV